VTQTPPLGPPSGYPAPPPGYAPQQQMVPPGYELKKKKPFYRRFWFWLLVAVVVIIAIVASSAGGGSGGSISGTDKIVYEITSDASHVSATYATFSGGSVGEAQDNSATPPWSKTVTTKSSWVHSFSLVGQMSPAAISGGGKDGTTISCKITVNGKVVAQQTSTGQYAAVTCNAS
jgi:hypothetical protein